MSQMCYAAGYGLKIENISSLLKGEFEDSSSSDLIDIVNGEDYYFAYFNGEDDFIYIPNRSPYEESLFKSIDEADTYIYEHFKSILKEDVTFEQFRESLDDIFDWDYC